MNKIKNYFKMWLIPLLLVMIMAGCEDRVGITTPMSITTPKVSSTNPINLSTSVAFNTILTATFSEAMDSLTITTATFTLMQGTSFVSGTVSFTGLTATFVPSSNLTPNTTYTATITTGVKDLEGSALAKNYVWSFTTGAAAAITPPTVNSTDPVNAAIGVPLNQKIAANFSVAMDATTIQTSTFTLTQGTTPISGFISYSGTTAIFAPSSNLEPNTAYTVTITTGAKDLSGISLANNYVWSFTTGAAAVVTPPTVSSTDPANAETDVPINQKIAVTFSKTMDASTVTTSTFTLMQGTTAVSGFVSYSGTTAIFSPSSNLAPNTTYTVTITTSAKDLTGNALANNYVGNFTTGIAVVITSPTVSSTDPVNAATGVPFNQKISATFSTTMDASTITASTFTLMQGTTAVSGFISYAGTTAIFAPSSNLAPNTAYTVLITTGAKDLAGISLANNYAWSFTTGAAAVVTPPTVNSTDPVNSEIGVAFNQKIIATFSKTMDASTITTSTFTLMQGTTAVSGFISYSGTTAIFAPSDNLAPNTKYIVTITTGVTDLAGNALANNYMWDFTTGAAAVVTPPTVNSTDPINAATGVAFNQKIAATFSKTMDASTITASTFILMQGTTSVSGFVSYSGTTATFAPSSNLIPNSTYIVTITTGAKDLAGNALVNNYVWSFTTGAAAVVTPPTVSSTDPVNAATGVAFNQKVAATFSKTMDASTITTSTFTLMQGTTPISGFISYSGTTAIFAPSSNLAPNTKYTVMITTGAKDLAGNALANNYVWDFTTGAAAVVTPPTINSTDPANAATGVALNQKIAAIFSKTMNASTITASTFTLTQGTTSVSGFVSYSGTTATFAPSSNLAPSTVYTATITTGARDLAGNALANNYVWSFTTGTATVVTPPTVISTDPVDDEICVALNKQVTATFSKTMDASTITTAIFTVMEVEGATFVSGTVSYVGTTATFIPLINLKMNTTYAATITTGAKDLAGNSMTNNYVWNFTTVTPYTVTLSSNPLAGGTTSGGGTFNSCSSVIVTATPNSGYTFTNWTENGIEVSTNANYTFTLNGNRTLVANFEINTYTLTVIAVNGTVTKNPNQINYNYGSNVILTAAPSLGYEFTGWSGDATGSTNPLTVTMNGNKTITANFTLISTYTLTVIAVNGTVTKNPNQANYNSGSSVILTATPSSGYEFTGWSGDATGSTNPLTVNMNGNKTITANFTALPSGPAGVDLGSAGNFAILAGSGVANTGLTTIYGDVGAFPTATMNGFPPGVVVGILYMAADPLVGTAKDDLTTAYNDAQGRSLDAISLPGQLGGLTLAPGLYVNSTSTGISGTGANGILTLDAGGNPNAVWIFKMGSTLVTDAGTSIVLAGDAKWENIYWSVGTSATLGTNSIFYGNILADQSITLTTGASLRGRALTRIAAVTLDANIVDKRP